MKMVTVSYSVRVKWKLWAWPVLAVSRWLLTAGAALASLVARHGCATKVAPK